MNPLWLLLHPYVLSLVEFYRLPPDRRQRLDLPPELCELLLRLEEVTLHAVHRATVSKGNISGSWDFCPEEVKDHVLCMVLSKLASGDPDPCRADYEDLLFHRCMDGVDAMKARHLLKVDPRNHLGHWLGRHAGLVQRLDAEGQLSPLRRTLVEVLQSERSNTMRAVLELLSSRFDASCIGRRHGVSAAALRKTVNVLGQKKAVTLAYAKVPGLGRGREPMRAILVPSAAEMTAAGADNLIPLLCEPSVEVSAATGAFTRGALYRWACSVGWVGGSTLDEMDQATDAVIDHILEITKAVNALRLRAPVVPPLADACEQAVGQEDFTTHRCRPY